MSWGGGRIVYFTYISDRIQHLSVGRIKLDMCCIIYYALIVFVISYWLKKTISKSECRQIKLFTDIFFRVCR